ncbi:nucleotidyl transferase AbiEii/AbiGii toxin family protein [Patescibacteria group bacterium]|nr:nucleotidyl transferase AbiEii/AbiGii toxin family protein [Patescibacteria group bacterium]
MTLNETIHKNILIKILKDIYTNDNLGPILGFKGGTAAYLFYNLNRFSVDLDFDLLDKEKEDHVFEEVKRILENYGNLKQAQKKRYNLLFILSYSGKEENAQNIKVEINRRDFGSKYTIKSYLGISMKIMIQEDMFAHKLCAMHERIGKANRDIFDVWFFLQNNWPINTEIIEKRTNMKFKEFMQECIYLLDKMSKQNILSGVGELINEKQKDWVRKKLKSETIFLLKLYIHNLK